jgi:hypothetical protein
VTRRRNPVAAKKKKASASSKAKKASGAKKKKRAVSAATRRRMSLAQKKLHYGTKSTNRARAAKNARARANRKKAGSWKRTSSVKLKAGYPMSKKRRKRYISEGKLGRNGVANPPRRKRRKRKKNPSLMACFQQLGKTSFWISGGQSVVGISAVVALPSVIEQVAARMGAGAYVRNSGGMGVALAAVSTALATCGAQMVENQAIKRGILPKAFNGLSARVAMGGMIVVVLKGLEVFARGLHTKLNLPTVPTPYIRVPGVTPAPLAAAGVQGMADWVQLKGMADWVQLKGGMSGGGLGATVMPDALVAGESLARSVSQFDGMSGLGGDYRIPMGSIRGMGDHYPGQYGSGMGDYITSAAGALPMNQGWQPSLMETF